MYRVVVAISSQQIPSLSFPNRKGSINMNFCSSYEAEDSWRDLTNDGKLVIPKKLYYRNQNGKALPFKGTNVNVGGFDQPTPLFLRGDHITISSGYKYFRAQNAARETTTTNQIFSGFISEVGSGMPIEMKLEDNMWLLKQTAIDTKTFSDSDGLNAILKFLVDKVNEQWAARIGFNITFNALTQTNFGTFVVGNESAAQVLQRLQKTYGFESFFRGNELRCGVTPYIESEAVTKTFTFQQDIIEDNIKYQRKDDIILSAIARNTITENTGATTKDGTPKTRKKRLEVLVSLFNGKITKKVINPGDRIAENNEGERRTFFFPAAKTTDDLANAAIDEIQKYYYDGLKGDFLGFALPYMRAGDNVNLVDLKMPERNGVYRLKKVEYSGSVSGGLRQRMYLDFKVNV
jgi:hypothetical protein